MSRLLLLTLLITVVYSWEDLKQTLIFLVRKILRQKHNSQPSSGVDQLVGTALILATLPINLVFLLIADGSLTAKLLVILTEFLAIGLLSAVVGVIEKKLSAYPHYADTWSMLSGFAANLVSPPFRVLGQIASHRRLFVSYLKHLSFPLLFGLALKLLVDRLGTDFVSAKADPLIMVAVVGLLMNAMIDVLESFFRANNMKLFSYFRIVLGILIIFVLAGKFV